MFENSLIDLGLIRQPVLKRFHWAVSVVVGAVFFTTAWFVLGAISDVETGVVNFQATVIGVFTGSWSLMVCYIWTDSRRENFSVLWMGLALFHLAGLVVYLFYSAAKTDDWSRASQPIAYILQGLILGVMILYPIIMMEALPQGQLTSFLVAPPPPPPPPPPPAPQIRRIKRNVTVDDLMRAPTEIPDEIAEIDDEPVPVATAGVVGGVAGGISGGQIGGVIGGIIDPFGAPPPPPKPVAPKRIRVGGNVQSAKLISKPTPIYPPLAKMARIRGTVRLQAVVSRSGTIKDLQVLSGHPLLVKAALDAVQRWRYQPTLLNGEPVEVITTIEVNFSLTG